MADPTTEAATREPPPAASEPDLADVVLGSVRGRHAFENCVERLATAIRLGIFPYGSRLPPERELALRMGVSRATLREGIAALRAARMVRTTRGRGGGTVVDQPPTVPGSTDAAGTDADPDRTRRDERVDALTFRRVVEPGAAYLAAGRPRDEGLDRLLTEAWRAADEATDPAVHRQADSRFHLAIAAMTGSDRLIDQVTGVQADLHAMLMAIPVLPVNIEHSKAQHAGILDAILAGSSQRARREMEDHCDDTAALLRGLLR